MPLILHLHPLSSYCHKVLMALYENGTPFEPRMVNLGDPDARAAYLKLSPFGKIPVLQDESRDATVIETSTILDYLQQYYPGPVTLIPHDPDTAREVRLWDRIFDLYIHQPMQRVVADTLRPEGKRDAQTVEEARATLRTAFDLVEKRLGEMPHPGGATFSIADCAAASPLFYAQAIEPFATTHPRLARYFEALLQRPSYARVLVEAKPFMKYFPLADRLPARFTA
ncbi:MAG: glutathione S-transferase family protein [Afipia sp.]|nr:glutathione S-transferase family protein [Afipia sp.]OJW61626.1 MAG: glutathione S-transferase [Afipia sp. 64-13]